MRKTRMARRLKEKRQNRTKVFGLFFVSLCLIGIVWGALHLSGFLNKGSQEAKQEETSQMVSQAKVPTKKSARIVASGDFLYHDLVYGSAYNGKTYDFANDFAQIQPLIAGADLALGDFEGTISSQYPLSGYPLFNAPIEVVDAIKGAGYDAITLAHNHILDSRLDGLFSTVKAFKDAGLDTFGVQVADEDILIKEVNGIKIALLAYSYGFNGMEATLTQAQYDAHMKDLDIDKIKADLARAEELADITVVMPQMGVEYQLEPSQEQVDLYHQMIDMGADIIFGGHPHVAEPTEIVLKDGEKKFILYSMGNLISNQRYETLENYWTERGVIMEVEVTKEGDKTVISNLVAHPTWVSRTPINRTFQGYQAYDYQVFLTEDYLEGGKYANSVDQTTLNRIRRAHQEMMELLNLKWE